MCPGVSYRVARVPDGFQRSAMRVVQGVKVYAMGVQLDLCRGLKGKEDYPFTHINPPPVVHHYRLCRFSCGVASTAPS